MSTTWPRTPLRISRDGLGEVQGVRGLGQDLVRVAQVGVDVGGGAFRGAGQQGPGVGQHQGVVVDVDDAGLRRYPLRDLVGVVRGRQAGADVEELPDARLVGQVGDAAGQEAPGGPGDVDDARERLSRTHRRPRGRRRSCPCRPASSSRSGPSAARSCRCRSGPVIGFWIGGAFVGHQGSSGGRGEVCLAQDRAHYIPGPPGHPREPGLTEGPAACRRRSRTCGGSPGRRRSAGWRRRRRRTRRACAPAWSRGSAWCCSGSAGCGRIRPR